jgi:hypothetical protein
MESSALSGLLRKSKVRVGLGEGGLKVVPSRHASRNMPVLKTREYAIVTTYAEVYGAKPVAARSIASSIWA